MVLEKRDIIKSVKEKFLDYLMKQEEKLKTIIADFTAGELERNGILFDNNQLLAPISDPLGWNDINEVLTSGSIYVEKLVNSISDILYYNDKIRMSIREVNYIKGIISVLELMILNKSNMESEMITVDFDHLSLYLLDSPLRGIESLDILMDFVSLNISSGLLEQSGKVMVLDPLIAQRKDLSIEKVFDLSEEGILNDLLNTDNEELSNEDIKMKQALLEVCTKSADSKRFKRFFTCHRILRNSYLNKVDSYQKEDIDKIISSLDGLGVYSELCQKIRATLNRELSKRLRRNSTNLCVVTKNQPSRESKYISDAEYKQVKKEISKYWDSYKMEAKKDLTEEERLYCAHLLLKVGTDSGLVRSFFYRTDEKPNLENPIGFYNHTYDKLKFYEQKCDLQQPLNNIHDYLQEMFIAGSEDYEFWKDEIKKELNSMIQRLPQSYEYELRQASTYYCKRKQKSKKES